VYQNNDLIACDRTGSGKTLSYVLPLTERLRDQGFFGKRAKRPFILCVLPTRELCVQVEIILIYLDRKIFNLIFIF
jgi:superfamily II DNA/RNA helicase